MIKIEEAKKIANEVNGLEYELELIGKEIEKAAKQGKYSCSVDIKKNIFFEIFNTLRKEKYDLSIKASNEKVYITNISW